jgi:hypothetical protein
MQHHNIQGLGFGAGPGQSGRKPKPRFRFMQDRGYGLPRISQPVEKVGIDPLATTNRARNVPKTGMFSCPIWSEAGTKGVFQHPVERF